MATKTLLRAAFAFAAAIILCTAAQAQIFRAYLASDGNDANPCTLQQPCRLLPAALNAIVDGGEIWMLDSANFNTNSVTIGKSVSILAVPGAVGSVLAINGPAISITAGGLKVALRNLVIGPFPGTTDAGVSMTGVSTLMIENSLIANMRGDGVRVVWGGNVRITNSIIRNAASTAVFLQNGATGEISGTQMLANGNGGVVAYGSSDSTTRASVTDSVISGGNEGVQAWAATAGAAARVFVTRSTIENTTSALDSNNYGLGTLISISASMVVNNGYGWYISGANSVIESSGNNQVRGNALLVGSVTPVGLQ